MTYRQRGGRSTRRLVAPNEGSDITQNDCLKDVYYFPCAWNINKERGYFLVFEERDDFSERLECFDGHDLYRSICES